MKTHRLHSTEWSLESVGILEIIESDVGFKSFCYPPSYDLSTYERRTQFIKNKISIQTIHGECKRPVFTNISSEFVGLIGLEPFVFEDQNYFEIGFRLLKAHWGKGFAVEFASELIKDLRIRKPHEKIGALVHVDNQQSHKTVKQLGLTEFKEFVHNCEAHIWYNL